jgi:hypothetical protein
MRHRCHRRLAFSLVGGLAFIFLAASVAKADEPADRLLQVGRSAIPARDVWERCLAAKVRDERTSSGSRETLADRALAWCKKFEARLEAVLARGVGSRQAATIVVQLRHTHRENLILVIRELRRK